MRKVLIYRHSLGKPSEPWIVASTSRYQQWSPQFVCRECLDGHLRRNNSVYCFSNYFRGKSDRIMHACFGSPSFAMLAIGHSKMNVGLVHSHFAFDALYGRHLAKAFRVPHVVTLHGNDVTLSHKALLLSGKASWVKLFLENRLLGSGVNTFIGVSECICAKAAKRYPTRKIVLCYLGVDEDYFEYSELPTGNGILHVGRLVEKKGTIILLRALADVAKIIPDVSLTVVGDGPLRHSLHEASRRLGVERRVRLVPHASRTQVRDFIGECKVFCLPSVTAVNGDSEGLPISILEAMSCGRPIVATRHAGIPEAVTHGENGLLTDEHDVQGLAAALVRCLSDASLCKAMGEHGRARIQRQFSLSVCSGRLEEIYNRAAQG